MRAIVIVSQREEDANAQRNADGSVHDVCGVHRTGARWHGDRLRGWPTPDGPAWVALPILDHVIPTEALLTQAQHVPVGMVEQIVHIVETGATGCGRSRGRHNVLTPYYQDEACTLYHATAETILPALPAQSVHLVLVDPPYFRVKAEAWDRQWKTEAAYLDWLRWLCMEWQRLLTPNGSLYCFASPQMAWQVEGSFGNTSMYSIVFVG